MFFFKGSFRTGGRNNQGVKTRNSGGVASHKRKYRFVDYKRSVKNVAGVIKRIELDCYRTSFVGLVLYSNRVVSYIITTDNSRL